MDGLVGTMCCHVYVGTSGFNLKTSSTRSVAHAGSVGFPNFQNAKQFMIDVASAFIIGAANVRWVCFVPFSSLCLPTIQIYSNHACLGVTCLPEFFPHAGGLDDEANAPVTFPDTTMQSHFGVVRVGDTAILDLPLNASKNFSTFSSTVINIPYDGGFTIMWGALDMASDQLILYGRPPTQAMPKIIFVVTDGQSQTTDCTYPCSTDRVREAADRARARGITVAVLTVGPAYSFQPNVSQMLCARFRSAMRELLRGRTCLSVCY